MSFVAPLLSWYQNNARDLPWRSNLSPYRTWVSEIMLQQTQVDTVIPYYERWMARFPDVFSLASADEQEVLSVWEGLGYYSRARNLHKSARIVVKDLDGHLPQTVAALRKLPGIGPYTAGAIAAIAFNSDEVAVDGNIRRVISRLFDIREPARSPEGEKKIWQLAEANLPEGSAGTFLQAMMDLGAICCTPKSPSCHVCPVADDCGARLLGVQEERPVRLPRRKIPHSTVTAAVIRRRGQVLIARRQEDGLLGGLWEFPGGTLEEEDFDLQTCLRREIMEELGVKIGVGNAFGTYNHAYTHFKITLHAFLCDLFPGEQPQSIENDGIAWVALQELADYPMGKVDRLIAIRLNEEMPDG